MTATDNAEGARDLAAALARASQHYADLRARDWKADRALSETAGTHYADVARAAKVGAREATDLVVRHLDAAHRAALAEDAASHCRAVAALDEPPEAITMHRVREARAAVDTLRAAGHDAVADAALSALRGRVLLAVAYASDLADARRLALAAEGVQ